MKRFLKGTVALDDTAFTRLMYPLVGFWAVLLTLFQGYRVHCSIRRWERPTRRLPRAPWWSLQLGAQIKVALVVIGLSVVAFLIGLIARAAA